MNHRLLLERIVMSKSLKTKTFSNIAYNSLAKVVTLVFQAFANIILTRTLTAADYGIVGFAGIFISFLGQFSDLGMGSALIQRHEINHKTLYTGFTVKFFLGIFICLTAWIVAPFSAKFFDNPSVVDVIRILSLSFVINTFIFLPNVLLTKELNYKSISFYNTLTVLFQSAVVITLALNGFKFWSIVFANLSAAAFTVLIVNIIRPVRPKFMFNRAIAYQLVNYGGNIFLAGFIVFVIFNIDNFMIGSVAGADQLGYYALAFNWGSMMCTLLSTTILTVMFPTLSTMEGNKGRIKNAYLRVLEYLSFAGILSNMTLFVIAKDFLVYVLGHGTDKWLPALATLRILCVYGIFRMLLEPVGSVIMAIGKTDQLRKVTSLVAVIELVFIYPVLIHFNIEGVAILVTIAYVSQYALYYPVMKKEINLKFSDFFDSVMPSLVSIITIISLFLFFETSWESSIVFMFIKIILCTLSYMFLHGLITKWKLFKEAYGMLQNLNTI
jgi:O-antigen/teichoic acid export membrane protein